jgi:hypothetical protein
LKGGYSLPPFIFVERIVKEKWIPIKLIKLKTREGFDAEVRYVNPKRENFMFKGTVFGRGVHLNVVWGIAGNARDRHPELNLEPSELQSYEMLRV